MSTKQWFKALGWAVIKGAATAAGPMVMDPRHFNMWSKEGWMLIGTVAGTAALFNLLSFLQRSPLPGNGGN